MMRKAFIIPCALLVAAFAARADEPSPANTPENLHQVGLILWNLQSSDPQEIQSAIDQSKQLAKLKPWDLDPVLSDLFTALLNIKKWDDALDIASTLIIGTPYSAVRCTISQRARVLTLLASQRYDQALIEAKSYYNIATFSHTSEAIDLLCQALAHTRAVTDPAIVMRFKSQQVQRTASATTAPARADQTVLASIGINPALYEAAMRRHSVEPSSYRKFMGQGNLFLLEDQPAKAMKSFAAAWAFAGTGPVRTQGVIDGIARAIRDQNENIQPANKFILSVRQEEDTVLTLLLPDADPEKLDRAAEAINLAVIPMTISPPLEQLRRSRESASPPPPEVTITTHFEGASPATIQRISPTHWQITLNAHDPCDWFMFKVEHAAHQTIRFDVNDPLASLDNWWTVDPVFTYQSIDNVNTFLAAPSAGSSITAWNGSTLPTTTGESWHYIPNTWMEENHTISFAHSFDADQAYIAMRVPYNPTYNQKYLSQISSRPFVKIITIGQSTLNRPLLLAIIGDPEPSAEITRPCVLMYAREHADEPDSSWVVKGAIDFLCSDDPRARTLRRRATFLFIPILDPDGAAASLHNHITSAFMEISATPESIAYANWFRRWVQDNHRIDVAVDFHNIQSREGPNISCPLLENTGARGKLILSLHDALVASLQTDSLTVDSRPWTFGTSRDRLGGWLASCFGSLTLAYELNAQAPQHHLNLFDLQHIGAVYVNTITDFLSTNSGTEALALIDKRRQQWRAESAQFVKNQPTNKSAIELEAQRSRAVITNQSRGSPELMMQ